MEMDNMDNIINNLVVIDKKAREIIAEAEHKSQNIINSINESQKKFELQYNDKVDLRLKMVKNEEAAKIKGLCKEIRIKYDLLRDKLERAYFKNHEAIENQIFERIINNSNN